jgi:hypothetical protein
VIVVGDKLPQIVGEQAYAAAAERARRLFKAVEMQEAAIFAATVHERAIDYLEQAPVLALCVLPPAPARKADRSARLYSAYRMDMLCQRGARLKDVMAAYGLPMPLRKLKPKALSFGDEDAIRALAQVQPSALSQAIPNSIAAQRKWLSAVREWRRLWRGIKSADRWSSWHPWAFVQMARYGIHARAVSSVADFAFRGDVPLNLSWEWPRAVAAAEDWHDRLSAGDAKAKYGVIAEQIIDLGDHPDHAVAGDFEFIALRTPIAIHAEGSAMRHCVASYVTSVVAGSCSIVSIRRDEQRIATMELRDGRIAQLKGRFNVQPEPVTRAAAQFYVSMLAEARKAAR